VEYIACAVGNLIFITVVKDPDGSIKIKANKVFTKFRCFFFWNWGIYILIINCTK